jgi:hypothetical protein
MRTLLATTLLLTLALGGCTAGVPKAGDESSVPADGKADSFRSPTEHGELAFGAANDAELGAEQKFHAWQFSLSGNASLSIETSSSVADLDTVMYLYRRDAGETTWGSYIEKNDDFEQSLLSRIEKELGSGEYRIIVKGYSDDERGAFSVNGTCTGAGCGGAPSPGDVEVPVASDFTHNCIGAIWEALGAAVASRESHDVAPDATSGFDREILVATAHYGSQVSEWREYAEEGFTFEVEIVRTEKGSLVVMADGGDESTTYYAFDQDGELLAYYVNNQSPWTEYFCSVPADEVVDAPPEDCLAAWMRHGPRATGSVTTRRATFTPGTANRDIDALTLKAIERYRADVLEEDARITVELTEWASADGDGGKGVEALLAADGAPMVTYTVVDSEWEDPWIVFESNENSDVGAEMVCAQ